MAEMTDVALQYLAHNYEYLFLKGRLEKAIDMRTDEGVLVVGSSHSLNGIDESLFPDLINCSMHSQDIYYDYACARYVIDQAKGSFRTCMVVFGYYIAYQDLSMSTVVRNSMVAGVYYPILQDAHNWDVPFERNRWEFTDLNLDVDTKIQIDRITMEWSQTNPYYSIIRNRTPFFRVDGNRSWNELTEEEKHLCASERAGSGKQGHGRLLKNVTTYKENIEIYKELIRYLVIHDVKPVVIIPPFTGLYNAYTPKGMIDGALELINSTDDTVEFVNFNESDMFEDSDFIDTDHLNENGSKKMTEILFNLFGEQKDK